MEEAGRPYERVLLDISTGAQIAGRTSSPINPMGESPGACRMATRTIAEAGGDLRLCRASAVRRRSSRRRSAIRQASKISLLAVLRAGLRRAVDRADRDQAADQCRAPPAGASSHTGVRLCSRQALRRARWLLGDAVHRGRYRSSAANLRAAIRHVQDGADAAGLRSLPRALRRVARRFQSRHSSAPRARQTRA